MRTIHFLSPLLLMGSLFFTSCQNEGNQQQSDMTEAQLVWAGEYMVDGCGFHVLIDGKKYKPTDEEAIDESFKVDGSTPVMISYELTGETIDRRCGLSPESKAMDGIRIISLEKQQ